ncbi:UNKNOWN [Stylonychia lemnae]|uniref:Uncharacterized protein n=1 Tax=Stylonychia lemnae TaxID=5949 RepID=A0A078B217_STYLE|nr:UNKNOWN [Stylonychia lemnae]|eukprot:CDW87398.1 UNKNOWN [Stylonychia lemnae]
MKLMEAKKESDEVEENEDKNYGGVKTRKKLKDMQTQKESVKPEKFEKIQSEQIQIPRKSHEIKKSNLCTNPNSIQKAQFQQKEAEQILSNKITNQQQLQLINQYQNQKQQIIFQQTTEQQIQQAAQYQMLMNGVSQAQYMIHHDPSLIFTQLLTSIPLMQQQQTINQLSIEAQQRIQYIQYLLLQDNINKEYLNILLLNEDPNIQSMIPLVILWGLNMQNIRDYVIYFMKFGVQNSNYSKLHRKIRSSIDQSSLKDIREDIFMEFSNQFFEFQKIVLTNLKEFQEIPQFLFIGFNFIQLVYRDYEIGLIRNFCKKLVVNKLVQLINMKNDLDMEWDQVYDTYILCRLIRRHGYGEYEKIINDQLWVATRPQFIQNLIKPNQNITALNQYVSFLKTRNENDNLKDAQILQPALRVPRFILYQKLSGVSIKQVKEQFFIDDQNPQTLGNVIGFNSYIDEYCIGRMDQEVQQFIQNRRIIECNQN